MKYLKLITILFIVNSAYAEVNKCVDKNGKITFTDKICKHHQRASIQKINPINIADSSTERKAISEFKRQQNNTYTTYHTNQPYEKDSITKGNEDRMRRMDSPLPNGLGTGKGCYWEHRQLYCY